jgi:hypothetical protein
MAGSLKIVRNIIVTLVGLAVIAILSVIIINLKDQPPTATAIEFAQFWDSRKPVNAADNGYIYVAGFDAASDELPELVGEKRIQWSNATVKDAAEKQELFRAEYRPEEAFIREIKTSFEQCKVIDKVCIAAIEKNKARIIEWSEAEHVIGERYTQLISHQGWLELSPVDVNSPIPNFALVLKAQRLAYMREFSARKPGERARLAGFLDTDLRFWRTVLRDTDMLIAKMIATVAIKNNFLWTNYFLLSLNNEERNTTARQTLEKPFTDMELSMYRSLVGEWRSFFLLSYVENTDVGGSTGKLLHDFFYKRQDTLNKHAESFKKLISAQDVPLPEFEAIFVASNDKKDEPQKSADSAFVYYLLNPYNPVGKILLSVAAPAYDNYVARSKDLETFRIGLLASIEQMKNESHTNGKYTSPYKTKPFVDNRENRSLKVQGLGNYDQSHIIYFY